MARDLFTNMGSTTVSSGGTTAPAAGTTQSWTVVSSSTFPAASDSASPVTQFYISDPALPTEIILVTNVSGTTWSVTRGTDGTTPVAHTAGFTVKNVVPAAWLSEQESPSNVVNIKQVYGAMGDGRTVTDGAMTSGSATLTSATAGFTSADVGKQVLITAATSTAIELYTTIASVTNSTTAVIAIKAGASTTSQTMKIDQDRQVTDGVTTNNSTTITSATASFTSADIGRRITISAAGRKSLATTISAFTNSTTVTLAASATRTCSAETLLYGTDDTLAFKNAVAVSGQQVYAPTSTYLLKTSKNGTGNIISMASNTRLFGDGHGSVLQAIGGDAANAGVDTFTLLGVNTYNTGGTTDPAANIRNVHIDNLHVRGTTQEEGFGEDAPDLITLSAVSNVRITNSKFSNFRSDAIIIGAIQERHNENIHILDCIFDGTNGNNRNAVSILEGVDIKVDRCYFTNCSRQNMPGCIDVEPDAVQTYVRVRDIEITNNYFTRVGGGAIIGFDILPDDVDLTQAAQGFLIEGNTFYDNCRGNLVGTQVIHKQTPTESTRPTKALITNNTWLNGGSEWVMYIEGTKDVQFVNNQIENQQSGLDLGWFGPHFGTRIAGNIFQNIKVADTAMYITNATNLLIENNIFDHCNGRIGAFEVGSDTTGTNGVTFRYNIVRQGSSNVTTGLFYKAASHTTTANANLYYDNIIPHDASMVITPFVSNTVDYTVTTGALTVDASLVAHDGTLNITTSTTATAGALTVARGVAGQILTVQYNIAGTNHTYATASTMKFAGGAAGTKSTVSGYKDIYVFRFDGTNWNELTRSLAVR